ncbi:hypothetical protein COLO4_25510 [Corchorus olitorius]|uniref:F-box domain-containing protein n=1 Tax=Corchorus olitorius TaxID=93759 RepID=A0A1R3I1Z6_9ROSI|nr:hypothetical protein COLO4_25510 [Corchorus olitorius]
MDGEKWKKMRAREDGGKGKEAKMLLTLIDLPTVMIMEILSWLPLKSLFKCRIMEESGKCPFLS